MPRYRLLRLTAILVLVSAGLAGCRRADDSRWPTLLPRSGEVSPLVPRTPLGACAGCGAAEVAAARAAPPPPPTPPPVPAPADAAARLDAAEAAIGAVETRLLESRRTLARAVAAADAAPGDADAATDAEVERSRAALLRVPLLEQGAALDALEDALAGADAAAPLQMRVAALRARLAVLQGDAPGTP